MSIYLHTLSVSKGPVSTLSVSTVPHVQTVTDLTCHAQTAAAKGLIIGDYTLVYADGTILQQSLETVEMPVKALNQPQRMLTV